MGSLDDISSIILTSNSGVPVLVRDVADVQFAPMLRQGAVTRDGDREAVVGMVMMIMGGNSRQVVEDVKHKIHEIEKSLPQGVYTIPFTTEQNLSRKPSIPWPKTSDWESFLL